MNIEPTLESPISLPVPRGRWGFLYGAFVLIMPAIAFWSTEFFKPEWQDGSLGSYIILLLSPSASWIFFPLLAFSIISYLFLATDPIRYSGRFTVRLGIYLGVLLALQFSIVSGLFFFSDNRYPFLLLLVWSAPLFVPGLYRSSVAKWGTRNVVIVLILLLLAAAIVLAVQATPYAPFLFALAAMTFASPFWCFLIFLRAATWLFKNTETRITLPHGLGLTAWLGMYAVAWRLSILKMYELYAALPPQPPTDCYIATAAAQGHPRFVGSRVVLREDGKHLQVNRQLQILKCAELALMATSPSLHKMLRHIYDVVGKSLARRMQNPFLADLAFLLLKPWEWCARSLLKMLIPEIDTISKKLYM
jgi:hypothetical protein